MSLASYYAWLSWFQDGARLIGYDTGQATASAHRLLVGADGEVSGDVLHERLAAALGPYAASAAAPQVLDAGCGLGGTAFFLATRLGGHCVGITLSPAQHVRATAEAARRGLAGACRFVVRSFDDDLRDLLPDGADLVVAIESLAHAPDPAGTIERLARRLRPGGRFAIVDDMPLPELEGADADFSAFRRGWMCPVVLSGDAITGALTAAGLTVVHDEDLSPLMRQRDRRALARRLRWSGMASAALRHTPAHTFVDSLHGGLMLERLYERRLMQYRLLVAARPAGHA